MRPAAYAWIALVVLIALFAPLLAPHDPAAQDLANVLAGPSVVHPLGTDALGQDVLSRLLFGARPALAGVAAALLTFLVLGVPLGLATGYARGPFARVLMTTAELLLVLPHVVVLLVVVTVFGDTLQGAMLALGVLSAPGLARIVRAATLSVRGEQYVSAARVAGLTGPAILRRHVLPRVAGTVVVQAALFAAIALLVQTGLSFLGAGPPPPAASWGGSLYDAAQAIDAQPALIYPPGAVVFLTILAFGLLGNAVRDARARPWAPAAPARGRAGTSSVDIAGPALLEVENLSIAFGAIPVVQDVSFQINPGEAIALLGESGSGKTLTARAILGLVPAGASVEGRCRFDGRDLLALGDADLRRVRGREIGFVAQEPSLSLDPTFTIGSVLAEATRRHLGLNRDAARRRAVELLARVRLPDPEVVARQRPGDLSGGMAQRAAIALALAGEPRLLIADEPTSALDATVRGELLALLRDLRRSTGMSLLLVTHDWAAAEWCDRAIVVYAGQIVEAADVQTLLAEPLHPYTDGLLAARPGPHTRGQRLPAIPGTIPPPHEWPASCHFYGRCRLAGNECRIQPIALESPRPGRLTRCLHSDQVADVR